MKRKAIAFLLTTTMLFTQSAPLLAGELESGQDNLLIEEEQFAEIAEEVDETVLFPEETDGELQEELTEVTDWGISEEIIEEIEGNDLPVAEELQPIEDEYYTAAPELVGDVAETEAEDEKPVIVLDQDTTVTVADGSEIAYFSFVPSESGDYYFLSNSDYDTYGSVYDADLTEIASDDDGGMENNFCLTVSLEADTQYYFGAGLYGDEGGSFTVRLEKYFDNEFHVEATNGDHFSVAPGADAKMEVTASYLAGDIIYKWYDDYDNLIERTNRSSFTAENIINKAVYHCLAIDEYGNYASLDFIIDVENEFSAEAEDDSIGVEPGGAAELKVNASCREGNLTYQWYDENGIIEGAATNSYSLANVTEATSYRCIVTDQYGNTENIWFFVHVDSGLTADFASEPYFLVTPGESVELKVNAECTYGGLTYRWEESPYDGDSSTIEGATSASYTVANIEKSCRYTCWVYDDFGTSWNGSFEITVRSEEIAPIQLDTDTQASITNAGNIVFFSFTPEETDYYRFYSTGDYDTYGYLYDENFGMLHGDDDEGEDVNFDLFYKMEAGTLYYCAAELVSKEETGSFTVRLEKKVLPASGESSDGLFWHFEDGVLTISGTGSNWYEIQAGYNVYREDTTKIVIEEGVTNIGSYAFGDCENVREAELPNSLTSIGTYAFMGCSALTEITIPAGVTMIGDVAFSACSSLKAINFEGDAPSFTIGEGGYQSQFTGVTATATYPVDNDTWTDEVMLDYGGSITWTPAGFSEGSVAASDITLNANASEEQSAQIEVTENLSGGTLTYASNNENVTVDELGKVTVAANFAGTATIWITSEAEGIYEEAETTITVTVNKIAGKVTAADITLEANMTESPTAQIEVTENLSGGELTYSSDNENVTVDAQGQITVAAGFMGTATITISAAAGGIYEAAEAAIAITVNELKPPITPEPQDPEPQEPEIVFTDVTDPETQPFYDYVYWAADNGITTGYEDGTFGPYKDCNRAATVTFIWRMAGEPEPSSTVAFDDMTGNEEFDKAILWAVENNITTGWSDNTFRPWNNCNRAAIVTFLWRYAGRPEPSTMAPFKDMTGNEEFDKAISWAWELGITTGYSDNTFRPWDSCNRLAAVSFLGRYDAL